MTQKTTKLLRLILGTKCTYSLSSRTITTEASTAINCNSRSISPIMVQPTVINNHQQPGDDNFSQFVTNIERRLLYHQWRKM